MENLKSFNQYVNEAMQPSMFRKFLTPDVFKKERYSEYFEEYKKRFAGDKVYGGNRESTRIYIPLLSAEKKKNPIEDEITQFLKDNQYIVTDYFYNKCKFDKPSVKNESKISVILNTKLKRPDLLKKFNEDPERKSGDSNELMVCITRHAYDVAGADTDRDWANCQTMKLDETHPRIKRMKAENNPKLSSYREEGSNAHYLIEEVRQGSILSYLISKDDKNLNKPTAIINIKPYEKDDEVYLKACKVAYGPAKENKDFMFTVLEFLKEMNKGKRGTFTLNSKVYRDTEDNTVDVGVLNISSKNLEDLSSISSISKNDTCIYLKCNNNLLTDLSGLAKLDELEELHCQNNRLQSLKGIENVTTLQVLDCSNNPDLKSLKGIENLTILTHLYCTNTGLKNMKGIENLKKLVELHVSDNYLVNLSELHNLKNVKILYCYTNELENLDGIQNLDLDKISCFDNNLTNLNEIKSIPNVKVFANNNKFEFPLPKEILAKSVAKIYSTDNVNHFKSYECQKEFLNRWPERADELLKFGVNDQIKEEFSDLF